MTEDNHKAEWEDLRDIYSELYKSTNEDIYRERYNACKRLLGEEKPRPQIEFFK